MIEEYTQISFVRLDNLLQIGWIPFRTFYELQTAENENHLMKIVANLFISFKIEIRLVITISFFYYNLNGDK